jgi:hypothetical protein
LRSRATILSSSTTNKLAGISILTVHIFVLLEKF